MTATSPRPVGITIIALAFLALAIATLGLAGFVLLSPEGNSTFTEVFERLQMSGALASLLAVPPLLTAGLAGLVFRGLWQQREWARLATMVVIFLFALSAIAALAFVSAFDLGTTAVHGVGLVLLLACTLLFVYLLRTPLEVEEISIEAAESKAELIIPDEVLDSLPVSIKRTPAAVPPPPQRTNASPGSPGSFVPPPPRAPSVQSSSGASDTRASALPTRQMSTPTASNASGRPVSAWLIVLSGGQYGRQFPLMDDSSLILGRDPAHVDAVLSDPTISGRHAKISHEQGRFILYDLDSTNGTQLNSQTIRRLPLQDGDEIRLGATRLSFVTNRP